MHHPHSLVIQYKELGLIRQWVEAIPCIALWNGLCHLWCEKPMSKGFEAFLKDNCLFHVDALEQYLRAAGKYNASTMKSALQYHMGKGHLLRVRRGYYMVTDRYSGRHVEGDAILIAAHMVDDAVISHHTAMCFHALAYSVSPVTYFYSNKRLGRLDGAYGIYQ